MFPISPPEPRGWRRWVSRSLDLLYPPSCAVCQVLLRDGRALCDPCHGSLPRLTAPFCKNCGEGFEGRIDGLFICPNCGRQKFSFEFARPALLRDERTLDMIHRLKYAREIHLAADLGRLAAEAFRDERLAPALAENWPLVPVPLYRKRFQDRGFNQAAEIARELSRQSGLPLLPALDRIRATGHQTALTRAQRLENLRNAFAVTRAGTCQIEDGLPGVILVDDVLTTGSTVDECARTLRRAGLKRIQVVTVMRG
ncbi:MAG: ComF family protein [Verrucomicrobiota bacterium]